MEFVTRPPYRCGTTSINYDEAELTVVEFSIQIGKKNISHFEIASDRQMIVRNIVTKCLVPQIPFDSVTLVIFMY